METSNTAIRDLCETFAATFLDDVNESWSKKYKRSINCSHPRGFSQRAHCAGRRARSAGKKTKSSSVSEMDRRGFLGALGAGAMAAAGVPAQAKSKIPEPTVFLSAHIAAEEMLHRAALSAGMRGAELAQFLAQCYHESAGFGRMHEYASGSEYEGRKDLGNIYKGDGVRYKGRGFIQITGRDNYRRAGQALGIPLEERPELASRPDVAAKIAVWYWTNRVKPNVDNFNDTRNVTRYINPKLNGLADRHENFKDYKTMFSTARVGR